jgi:EAL domain-containing protein (putative c-di-GMP-specific phosphodiesterase class I)
MLEIADRRWPRLLERLCTERLFQPAYQPILDTARGVVCGYEGLARVLDGVVPVGPEALFAAAALHGYAGRVEAAAATAIIERRDELPSNCFLSINFSPDALLDPAVEELLEDDLSGLVVEITEQTPVEDYPSLTAGLDRLRERGALVAVDDTGAGYASLSHILRLRPDFVKVDRELVSGLDRDPHRAAAVSAIGAMAGELNAWLIAEGVERDAELDRLIELEVPLVQGFLVGRPAAEMQLVSPAIGRAVRARQLAAERKTVASLVRPALSAYRAPDIVAETVVLLDDHDRPRSVVVPGGGRRAPQHPAMCVQLTEEIASVALRAAARRSDDCFVPVCVCDDRGHLRGVVAVERLLETLAREALD